MMMQIANAIPVVKAKIRNFFTNERGDVNVVAIVVLIAVAVVLALFFKEEIASLLQTLIQGIKTKAGTALNDI